MAIPPKKGPRRHTRKRCRRPTHLELYYAHIYTTAQRNFRANKATPMHRLEHSAPRRQAPSSSFLRRQQPATTTTPANSPPNTRNATLQWPRWAAEVLLRNTCERAVPRVPIRPIHYHAGEQAAHLDPQVTTADHVGARRCWPLWHGRRVLALKRPTASKNQNPNFRPTRVIVAHKCTC